MLLHELDNTRANEGLCVRMAHGHKHVLADCDAAAPFRKNRRMILKAADPHQKRRGGRHVSGKIEACAPKIFRQHAIIFGEECELVRGKLLPEEIGWRVKREQRHDEQQ